MSSRMLPASRIGPVVAPSISRFFRAGWIKSWSTASKSIPLRVPKGRTTNARFSIAPSYTNGPRWAASICRPAARPIASSCGAFSTASIR